MIMEQPNNPYKYGILLSDDQLKFLSDPRQGFSRMVALRTFITLAAMHPCRYQKQGFACELDAGQFAISIVELAALWKCDRKTATKVVELFNQVGLLTSVKNNRTTVHTIHCIAFWYTDDSNEPIKNPHYRRNAVDRAPQAPDAFVDVDAAHIEGSSNCPNE